MSDDPLTLLSAAPAPPMTVDPYAAMATARRNRARRRVVTALAAVAAVVALAFGGWVITGGREHHQVPAGTKVEKTTVQPFGSTSTTLVPFPSIEVSSGPTRATVAFTGLVAGRRVALGAVAVPAGTGRTIVSNAGTPPMVLGVLPAGASPPDISSIVPTAALSDITAYWKGVGTLPGSGRLAFAIGFATRADAQKVQAIVWIDPTGGVHVTDDSVVSSTRFAGPSGGTRVIYVDERLRVVGLVESPVDSGTGEGSSGGSDRAQLPPDGAGLFAGGGGTSTGPSGTTTEAAVYGLLPSSATDVHLVDASGKVLPLVVTTHSIPGTRYLGVYAEEDAAGEATPVVDRLTAMTWTDVAGVGHVTSFDSAGDGAR